MIAALNGQQQCLDVLIKAGAQVDRVEEEFGMSAFLWACHSAHLRCVERLIKAGCDIRAKEVTGLNGMQLAKENMRLGWERVVEIIKDEMMKGMSTSTDLPSSDGSDNDDMMGGGTTVDAEHEKAVSAARNRRMARLVGDTNEDDVDNMILSSEKTDTPKAPTPEPHYMTKKLNTLTKIESADEVLRRTLSKSASSMRMAEANSTNGAKAKKLLQEVTDDDETREYLQVWAASDDLIGIIQNWMDRAVHLEPTVTNLLMDLGTEAGGQMYGLDFNLKTKSSLARKVLEKTKGDASQFEKVVGLQNDALRESTSTPPRYTTGDFADILLLFCV